MLIRLIKSWRICYGASLTYIMTNKSRDVSDMQDGTLNFTRINTWILSPEKPANHNPGWHTGIQLPGSLYNVSLHLITKRPPPRLTASYSEPQRQKASNICHCLPLWIFTPHASPARRKWACWCLGDIQCWYSVRHYMYQPSPPSLVDVKFKDVKSNFTFGHP